MIFFRVIPAKKLPPKINQTRSCGPVAGILFVELSFLYVLFAEMTVGVGVGVSISVGVGVGVMSWVVGFSEGTILPNRVRRLAEMRLLERMTIIKKINAKNIRISLLDVIRGL